MSEDFFETFFQDSTTVQELAKNPGFINPKQVSGKGCPPDWYIFSYRYEGYPSPSVSPDIYFLEQNREKVIKWLQGSVVGRFTYWTYVSTQMGLCLVFEQRKDAFGWIILTGFDTNKLIISKPSKSWWANGLNSYWENL